jgi:DNA gyrase subunit A
MTNSEDSIEERKAATMTDEKVRRLTPDQLDIPTSSEGDETDVSRIEKLEQMLEETDYSASTQVAVATAEDEYATAFPLNRGKSDPVHALELAVWKAYSKSRTLITDIVITSQEEDFELCGRCYQTILDFASNPQVRVINSDEGGREDYVSVEQLLSVVNVQNMERTIENDTSLKTETESEVEDLQNDQDTDTVDDVSSEAQDLDIEYVRFDSPIYHRKYKKLSRTFCGQEIKEEDYKTADEEPILLDPCQSCFGEAPVKTVEEQKQDLRERISEQIIDIQTSRVSPDEFNKTEMRALLEALPVTLPEFEPTPEKIRFHLSRAIENIGLSESSPQKFSRDELEALVEALDGEGIVPSTPQLFQLDEKNRVKRVSISDISTQRRGGKGHVISSGDNSHIRKIAVANPRDKLFLFTNQGKIFQMNGYEIPQADQTEAGNFFSELVNLDQEEEVLACLSATNIQDHEYVITVSKDGYVKRTSTEEFENILSTGIIAVEIEESDELCGVEWSAGNQDIFISTAGGRCIRFHEKEVRAMGRNARGAQGIELKEDDTAVGVCVVDHDDAASGMILTTTANGYGKRTSVDKYKIQSRYGIGLVDIITDERNGPVIDISQVDDDSLISIQTKKGRLIEITVSEISTVGRNTKGVILIDTDDSDEVVSMAVH